MTRMTRMGGNPPSSYPCNPCNPWSISKGVAVVLASKRRSRGGLFLTELPPQNIGLWPRAHPGRRHFPKRSHGHCQRVNLQLFVAGSAIHGMTMTMTSRSRSRSRRREYEKSGMRTERGQRTHPAVVGKGAEAVSARNSGGTPLPPWEPHSVRWFELHRERNSAKLHT